RSDSCALDAISRRQPSMHASNRVTAEARRLGGRERRLCGDELFALEAVAQKAGEEQAVEYALILTEHLVRRAHRHALEGFERRARAVAGYGSQELGRLEVTAMPEWAGHATAPRKFHAVVHTARHSPRVTAAGQTERWGQAPRQSDRELEWRGLR